MNKKILIAIITIIILIILLLITILAINAKTNDNNINSIHKIEKNEIVQEEEIYYNEIENNQIIENINNKAKYITNKNEYFIIKNMIEKYINIMADGNKEGVIKLLSPAYLNEFGITKDNIKNNIPKTENNYQSYYLDINELFLIELSNRTNLYIMYGNISIKYKQETYPIKMMIETDKINLLYNIYPSDYLVAHKLDNVKEGDTIKHTEKEIVNQDNFNKYQYTNTITDINMANELFNDFIYKLKINSKEAYNKLDNTYKKKKFETFNDFKINCEERKDIINILRINEYKVYSTKDYTDYICTDQYNNYYIFRQQGGIMRYTVFLDTYTVELDAFKEKYEKSSNGTKLSINIDKFKQMLNTKDYNAIYNKLNVVFRNNNFNNISKLKEYLQKNVYDINSIELNNYNQNEDYYVCECTLYNQKNTNEKKNMTIVMKLIDSNNFEMSFSMN